MLSSGVTGEDAIVSVTVTQAVNSGTQLKIGSVCAAMLEATVLGDGVIAAGERLTVWRQDEEGNTYDLGVFIAEKPVRKGAHYLKVTAYDPVVLLDKDVTILLQGLPTVSLQVLAEEVCRYCGVTLAGEQLPLGELPVTGISGQGITGRQVLGWIGELTGKFCRANTQGQVEFSWYRENADAQLGITAGAGHSYKEGVLQGLSGSYDAGALTLAGKVENGVLTLELTPGQKTLGYYQGGLTLEEYTVAVIEKVQLRKSADDVGTVYPDGLEEGCNTYIVEGNPLLGALPEEVLPTVAEHLFGVLQGVCYTPCKVSLPASFSLAPGDVVQLTDKRGKTFTIYIMTKTQQGQKDTLECTGEPRRDSSTVTNNRSYADLQGKVMNLRTDLQGLYAEHSNTADKTARLELDMDGIRGQVSHQEGLQEKLTSLEQTAESLRISVEKLHSDGADKLRTGMGYTFDDQGLNIHKDDSEITNRLDENGMVVLRNAGATYETVMLQADTEGVVATDVKVRNYLIIGTHARLEDYPEGRTACFWLEG